MAKDKKKQSKKGGISEDLLDVAAVSLKKFRKVTRQVTKLSTGQKLVGGVALLAAGLTYLARQQGEAAEPAVSPTSPGVSPDPKVFLARPEPTPLPKGAGEVPKKARKSAKSKS